MKKLFLAMMLILGLLSCGKSGIGGKSISFNMEAEPNSLDPQLTSDMGGFIITDMAYEGLLRLNEKNEIVPASAESWKVSDDGKVWTLTLRKNLKWSNGDPIKAQDYYNAIKRGIDPETSSEYAFITYYIKGAEDYNTGKIKDFNQVGVKVKDDYTIEFTLSKPAAYFGKTLVMPIYFPVNEKALAANKDKYASEADKSVYNGPYIIKKWVHDNKVVLEKNPNYWNAGNIKINQITALMVPDFDTATNLFKNKELGVTRASIEKSAEFKGKPELRKVSNGRLYYLAFNQKIPALKSKKVREALALAINRDDLVEKVLSGGGVKTTGVVADQMRGISKEFREENGDLYAAYKNVDVKKLFDEGLKEEGLTPDKVHLTLTVDEKGTGKREAEFYQSQWKEKLGIDVQVEVLTYKERLSRGKEGNFEIIRSVWGPDYADAMTYLEIFASNGLNIAKNKNPEYDKLIEEGKVITDNEKRMQTLEKAEKVLANDFVYSGLYYELAMYLVDPKIENVTLRAVGSKINFNKASVKSQ